MKGLQMAASILLGLFVAFVFGFAMGKEAGRADMILEDMARDRALQAYVDCILLRGKDLCPKPPGISE